MQAVGRWSPRPASKYYVHVVYTQYSGISVLVGGTNNGFIPWCKKDDITVVSSGVDGVLSTPDIVCGIVHSHNVVSVHGFFVEEHHFEVNVLVAVGGGDQGRATLFLENQSEVRPEVLF